MLGFGRMAMNEPAYGSATPAGIMRLLAHYRIPLEGRTRWWSGRSPILGKPVAMMLLNANATVTICHSKTQGLAEIVRSADIVVGAVAKPEFIKGAWIRDGAVVVDAGYHPGNVGDIELSAVIPRCSAYTPVPGGVGPMTIATLIAQTVAAAEAPRRTPRAEAVGAAARSALCDQVTHFVFHLGGGGDDPVGGFCTWFTDSAVVANLPSTTETTCTMSWKIFCSSVE